MKRILFLNYEFPPLGGGAAFATYNLLKEFSENDDIKIDLITSSIEKSKKEIFSRNITIYYLDIGKKDNIHTQSNWNLLAYSYNAFSLARKLKRAINYNLVHAFFGVPCGFLAMLLSKPYIVSLRGSDVPGYSEKYRYLDKFIFRNLSRYFIWKKASFVVANSDGLRNLALKTFPQLDIRVIPNGVDTNKFCPGTSAKSNTFSIIYNSRFISRKGITYLTEAFIKFNKKYPDSKLILVSSGDLEEEIRDRIQAAGVSSSVSFRGTFSPLGDEIANIYREGQVFVLPSLNEGMSNSLLEAMASGLPVITTDTGGSKELVDKYNGVLIRKKNASDIYQALEYLYKNRQACFEMGQNSRKKVMTKNWCKVATQYLSLYNHIQKHGKT